MEKLQKMKIRYSMVLTLFLFPMFLLQAQEIQVMTYNVKYANENDGENSWSKRKQFITNQLNFYEPDIMGLQEVLFSQIQHFTSEIGGYNFVGKAREDGKQKGEFTAILFKNEKFELIEDHTFWLSETPGKVSTGWDAALPRVCTYALFRDKNTGKKFWFFNSHFDHVGTEARTESARLILKKIEEVNTENLPVVLTGDFNLEPESEGIKLISEKLKDSRNTANTVFGSEGTFNGYQFDKPASRRIDYIFVNENVEVKKYAVLTDSKEMKYPSDHFPVITILEFR